MTKRLKEKFYIWLAWRLPKDLVMWCWYRVAAHATTGKWGSTDVVEVKMMDAIDRWIKEPPS